MWLVIGCLRGITTWSQQSGGTPNDKRDFLIVGLGNLSPSALDRAAVSRREPAIGPGYLPLQAGAPCERKLLGRRTPSKSAERWSQAACRASRHLGQNDGARYGDSHCLGDPRKTLLIVYSRATRPGSSDSRFAAMRHRRRHLTQQHAQGDTVVLSAAQIRLSSDTWSSSAAVMWRHPAPESGNVLLGYARRRRARCTCKPSSTSSAHWPSTRFTPRRCPSLPPICSTIPSCHSMRHSGVKVGAILNDYGRSFSGIQERHRTICCPLARRSGL